MAASRFRLLQKFLQVIMAEQRSAFYVGEKFSTYNEFADKLTIGYCQWSVGLHAFDMQ